MTEPTADHGKPAPATGDVVPPSTAPAAPASSASPSTADSHADRPQGKGSDIDDLPRPHLHRKRRWSVSLVWLVPLVALVVGVSLLIRSVLLVGPRVEIEFASAESIVPGKTEVRYKEVVIGKVEAVSLRDDRKHVIVTVRLDRASAGVAAEDTSFWVVRPRIATSGISGLGTLLSGAYIGADVGTSAVTKTRFVGLEAPPLVLRGEPGSIFVLKADDLGSLDVGSPVFHRRTRVGRVVGYALDADRDELYVNIFVEAPFQKLITNKTRFWNASGIDLSVNASGLTLNTQTLVSVLAGGLAFEAPPNESPGTPATERNVFTLFNDRRSALAPPDGPAFPIRMVFAGSARGLAEGAPIDFLGIEIGRVRSVALQYDAKRERFPVQVLADVFPLRLGPARAALLRDAPAGENPDAAMLQRMVDSGLRAQLRTGNLLTGQLYVALDFTSETTKASMHPVDGAYTLPTVPGTLSELQPQIASIVQKISKIPFDDIGTNLQQTLKVATQAISQLTPEAQQALAEVRKTLAKTQATLENLDRNVADPGAPLQRNVEDTMLELQRASRSFRVLADYLQQHPEALLRGKPADPVISSPDLSGSGVRR